MDEFGMYFFRYLVFKAPLPKKREAFVFFKIVMVMIETESSGGVVVRVVVVNSFIKNIIHYSHRTEFRII